MPHSAGVARLVQKPFWRAENCLVPKSAPPVDRLPDRRCLGSYLVLRIAREIAVAFFPELTFQPLAIRGSGGSTATVNNWPVLSMGSDRVPRYIILDVL